jgi:hypothetical protein
LRWTRSIFSVEKKLSVAELSQTFWVEVSAPGSSDAAEEVKAAMDQFAALLTLVPHGKFADIFIRRDMTPDDVRKVRMGSGVAPSYGKPRRVDLAPAIILYDHFAPSNFKWDALPEAMVSRMSMLHYDEKGGRELLVRHVFPDSRAARLLRREAEQLLRDGPGLIMLDDSPSAGPVVEWPPLIEAALRPGQHTRVSAAALFFVAARQFRSGVAPTVEMKAIARLIKK